MNELIVDVVVLGLIAGLLPFGVTAIVIVAASGKRSNTVWFVVGWMIVMAAVTALAATVLHDQVQTADAPSDSVDWASLILGVVCLVGAAAVRSRPPRVAGTSSALNERLAQLGPTSSFGAGILLAPYPAAIAAGLALARADVALAGRLVALSIYDVLSVWTMLVVLGVLYFRPDRANAILAQIKNWMSVHGREVGVGVLVVIGVVLIARGIGVVA